MHNLDLVQMAHAKDKRPSEISGGMKQRVGIARALAMEPKVLLLDEPFGALDALTRAHLQDSVMAIHQKLGNTVMMITHDVDEAVLLSDRIVMMTNGPSARIGEVLDVPLAASAQAARAGRRPDLPQVPAARAGVPLRAPSLRRGGLGTVSRYTPGRALTARNTSMTPQQVVVVQESFAKILPIAETASELFYARLFEIAPHVRSLFPSDMSEQSRRLMLTLVIVVNGLPQLSEMRPAVAALAKRHAEHGVEPRTTSRSAKRSCGRWRRDLAAAGRPNCAMRGPQPMRRSRTS